jgi:hypothetical protein
VRRYEDLRRQSLEEDPMGGGWGLTLFLRRGLVAWMHAWPPGSPRGSDRSEAHAGGELVPAENDPPVRESFPSHLRRPVAALLADMILETRQEFLP